MVEFIICNVILLLISRLLDFDWIYFVFVGIFFKVRDLVFCLVSVFE